MGRPLRLLVCAVCALGGLAHVACVEGGGGRSPATGAAGQGQAGTSPSAGTSGSAGTGASAAGQAGGGGSAGTTGSAGNVGSAGSSGGAGTGGAGTGVAGTSGGAGIAGAAGATGAAGSTPGIADPGSEGDGNFTLPSGHTADPLNNAIGAPMGSIITFQMKSSESTIYPGRNGKAYTRNVWAYVPKQYAPGTPAPVIAVQDGGFDVWFGTRAPHTPNAGAAANLPGTANLPRILDNLINMGKLPKIVAVFADNGGGDAEGSERGLEYDTVSGRYAEFLDTEVLPRVAAEVKTQLAIDLVFTKDPQGRMTMGGSSGAAGSFSSVWFHPDLFARVISFSGTYVRQASPEEPMYPHGCWCYHSFDPFDAAAPNGLIMKEPAKKPIRVWLQVSQNDLGAGSGPGSYRDFKLANDRMAASFKAKGYHYHYDYAMGAGHFDGNVIAQTLPTALQYVWRGYPLN